MSGLLVGTGDGGGRASGCTDLQAYPRSPWVTVRSHDTVKTPGKPLWPVFPF